MISFYIFAIKFIIKTIIIMKKITFLLLTVLFTTVTVFGQSSQRLALAEEFTNASCGPCAGQNPAFDALLQQNTDKMISIKYHMSWPGPDPMYSHNTVDNNARRSVYGINGVPHVHVDGNWWNGMPSGVTQNLINTVSAIPSPCEIQVHYELNADNTKINVTALVNPTDTIRGNNLRLFLVVIEKHIHFNSAPGYNGEKDFYNVMKKILPDKNGLKLDPVIIPGEYLIVEDSWELANVYNNDELSVVAFIQNMDDKEVHQAAGGTEDPLTPLYADDVEVNNLYYATDKNCSGKMTPKVVIRNNGSNEITSMEIQYHINNGDTTTINWTGNLAFLEKEEIQLPELNFAVEDTNHLIIEVVSINGGSDEYYSNNVYDHQFYRADILDGPAYMFLSLDDHPEQTTWKLFNYAGDVVQEGGPYSTPNQLQTIELEFTSSSCYRFEIYDSGNDGLTGNGFYQVVYGTNSTAFEGGDFTDKDVNEITYDIVGVSNEEALNNLNIYPNPANSKINVSFVLNNNQAVSVSVYDLLGKEVLSKNMGNQPSGTVTVTFDVSSLETGVYFVKTSAGDKTYVNKVLVK